LADITLTIWNVAEVRQCVWDWLWDYLIGTFRDIDIQKTWAWSDQSDQYQCQKYWWTWRQCW